MTKLECDTHEALSTLQNGATTDKLIKITEQYIKKTEKWGEFKDSPQRPNFKKLELWIYKTLIKFG